MNEKWWVESAFTADSVEEFHTKVRETANEALSWIESGDYATMYRLFGAIAVSLEWFENSEAYKNEMTKSHCGRKISEFNRSIVRLQALLDEEKKRSEQDSSIADIEKSNEILTALMSSILLLKRQIKVFEARLWAAMSDDVIRDEEE